MMYSIKQASEQSGLSAKTIRFYEDKGVIKPAVRSANGYRQYSSEEIEYLVMIRKIKDLGLPLTEIKKLINGCNKGNCLHSAEESINNLSGYISLLSTQIRDLIFLKNKLTGLVSSIKKQGSNQAYCCDYLHQLINIPEGGE